MSVFKISYNYFQTLKWLTYFHKRKSGKGSGPVQLQTMSFMRAYIFNTLILFEVKWIQLVHDKLSHRGVTLN